jgi:hypothetical protein
MPSPFSTPASISIAFHSCGVSCPSVLECMVVGGCVPIATCRCTL